MAKEKKEKSKFRIYAEYYPFCVLYGILHLLPLKVGYAICTFLFRLLFIADRRHRVRTIQHLVHAGLFANEAEARRFAKVTYLEFAKLLVEIVKMNQLYSRDKISIVGSPEAIEYAEPGPGKEVGGQVIIVTAHYGNWEVAGTAYSEQANRPMTSFMRPFGNPLIGEMILNHRGGDLHDLVDKHEGIRPILRAAAAGRNITMLIDQHAAGAEGVDCEFFGHPARIHMTPALLHLKTGIPILPEITRRKPGSNFEFELVFGDLIRYKPDVRDRTRKTDHGAAGAVALGAAALARHQSPAGGSVQRLDAAGQAVLNLVIAGRARRSSAMRSVTSGSAGLRSG